MNEQIAKIITEAEIYESLSNIQITEGYKPFLIAKNTSYKVLHDIMNKMFVHLNSVSKDSIIIKAIDENQKVFSCYATVTALPKIVLYCDKRIEFTKNIYYKYNMEFVRLDANGQIRKENEFPLFSAKLKNRDNSINYENILDFFNAHKYTYISNCIESIKVVKRNAKNENECSFAIRINKVNSKNFNLNNVLNISETLHNKLLKNFENSELKKDIEYSTITNMAGEVIYNGVGFNTDAYKYVLHKKKKPVQAKMVK